MPHPRVFRATWPAMAACAAVSALLAAARAQAPEPLVGGATNAARTGEAIVAVQCAKCHQAGEGGAPRIGDRPAWIPRMKRGLDTLVASAIQGHGAMPARGGMPDLTDPEIRNAIVYMFNHGWPAQPAPASPVMEPPSPRHQFVSGTDVYLGMMSAEALRGRARAGTPAAAATEVPSGKGYYHVNLSLVDGKSRAPVTDARVTLRVSDGMTAVSRELHPATADGTVSYGAFLRFASGSAYNITADIRRPGVPGPIEARFQFMAP